MVFIESVRRDLLTCQKCGHKWFMKDPEKPPKRCPKCHRVRWWEKDEKLVRELQSESIEASRS